MLRHWSKHLSDGDDLTSTTAVCRVTLSPNSKETNCVLCVENVSNPNYRRGLSKDSSLKRAWIWKSSLARNSTEKAVWLILFVETAPETTTTLFEKILEIRKQFLSQLKEDRGSAGWVKRLNKDSNDQKTRLFFRNRSGRSSPHLEFVVLFAVYRAISI